MKSQVPMGAFERAIRLHQVSQSTRKQSRAGPKRGRVITVSRLFGGGGISVSRLLGRRLGWPVWDRGILDLLAQYTGGKCDAELLRSVDERIQTVFESMLTSFCHNVDYQSYLCLLPRVIRHIARNDAIILGRGAHLVCPHALRVFLKASPDKRVQNVSRLYTISLREAERVVQRRDQERVTFLREFTKRLGNADLLKQNPFDLEINTDVLSFDQAADLISSAARLRFADTDYVH